MLGKPIILRRLVAPETDQWSNLEFCRWYVYDKEKDTKPIYTVTADKIRRIRNGVYETVIPGNVCGKTGEYYDSLVSKNFPHELGKFTVHEHVPPLVGYASVVETRQKDLRLSDQTAFPDAVVNQAVETASNLIERWTGRWFTPKQQTIRLDGADSYILPLPQPLLVLESIHPFFNTNAVFGYMLNGRDPDPREEQIDPQASDCDNPCLTCFFFPRGKSNIIIKGLFGTVDQKGEPPSAIVTATARLAAKQLLQQAGDGGVA